MSFGAGWTERRVLLVGDCRRASRMVANVAPDLPSKEAGVDLKCKASAAK